MATNDAEFMGRFWKQNTFFLGRLGTKGNNTIADPERFKFRSQKLHSGWDKSFDLEHQLPSPPPAGPNAAWLAETHACQQPATTPRARQKLTGRSGASCGRR
jgi:hypothetical protein